LFGHTTYSCEQGGNAQEANPDASGSAKKRKKKKKNAAAGGNNSNNNNNNNKTNNGSQSKTAIANKGGVGKGKAGAAKVRLINEGVDMN
jgi:hypothetical protein